MILSTSFRRVNLLTQQETNPEEFSVEFMSWTGSWKSMNQSGCKGWVRIVLRQEEEQQQPPGFVQL